MFPLSVDLPYRASATGGCSGCRALSCSVPHGESGRLLLGSAILKCTDLCVKRHGSLMFSIGNSPRISLNTRASQVLSSHCCRLFFPLVFTTLQEKKVDIRNNDKTVAPTSFLWAAYLPHRYFFEVFATTFVSRTVLSLIQIRTATCRLGSVVVGDLRRYTSEPPSPCVYQ